MGEVEVGGMCLLRIVWSYITQYNANSDTFYQGGTARATTLLERLKDTSET